MIFNALHLLNESTTGRDIESPWDIFLCCFVYSFESNHYLLYCDFWFLYITCMWCRLKKDVTPGLAAMINRSKRWSWWDEPHGRWTPAGTKVITPETVGEAGWCCVMSAGEPASIIRSSLDLVSDGDFQSRGDMQINEGGHRRFVNKSSRQRAKNMPLKNLFNQTLSRLSELKHSSTCHISESLN